MKIFRISLLLLIVSLAGCISWVFAKSPFNDMPAGKYTLDLSHGSVVWKVSHFGLSNYVARFTEFDASIDFKPNDVESSSVSATINPMSIQTAFPNPDETDFDKVLATDSSWFNANKFSSIRYTSTSITMTGENTAVMNGELNFLGLTKEIKLDVTFNGAMLRQPLSGLPTMGFSAQTQIVRSDFGMTKYVPQVGDAVEVFIEGEFTYTEDE